MKCSDPADAAPRSAYRFVGPGPEGVAIYQGPRGEFIYIHVPKETAAQYEKTLEAGYAELTDPKLIGLNYIGKAHSNNAMFRNLNDPNLDMVVHVSSETGQRILDGSFDPLAGFHSRAQKKASEESPRPKPQEETQATVNIIATPNTRTYAELAEILQSAANRMESLHNAGMENPQLEGARVRSLLKHLTRLEDETQNRMRAITTKAVIEGYISRVEAGELMGVHQATVARWVKEEKNKANHAG